MSRRACLSVCLISLCAFGQTQRSGKSRIDRSTPLEAPTIVRMEFPGGVLAFERTADSSTLRGVAQDWIMLYQPGEKADFWVFDGVLTEGDDANMALTSLHDAFGAEVRDVATDPKWRRWVESANWNWSPLVGEPIVEADARWVPAKKGKVLSLLGLGVFIDEQDSDINIATLPSPCPPGNCYPTADVSGWVAGVGCNCQPGSGGPDWACINVDCNDNNYCTFDACSNGVCQHVAWHEGDTCPDEPNSCTTDICVNGQCTHWPHGGPCDDDGNPCTDDECGDDGQGHFGCIHLPVAVGTPCPGDPAPCTIGNYCQNGQCAPHIIPGASCDDGNPCTIADQCDIAGGCAGTQMNCEDGNPCTAGQCINGACVQSPLTGPACEADGDQCTQDSCVNGQCVAGHPNCEAGEDPCNPNPVANHYPQCLNCLVTITAPASVLVNCDGDDQNGVPDDQQSGPIAAENDLVVATISWTAGCAQMAVNGGQVVWRIEEGSGNRTYRVW